MFMRSYKPDINDAVRYAIFNHPNGHAHLPSTVLQISGMDPLRDEGLLYEQVLKGDRQLRQSFTSILVNLTVILGISRF